MRCAAFSAALALLSVGTPAMAQDVSASQTTDSSVGQVGQRQTREDSAPNIQPMGRINSRVTNRVQSRIRNRLDRYYDPQANAASPFEIAGEQTRRAGRPVPR